MRSGWSNGLLVLVGVLGFVDDMLESLASLVQIDLGFINSRLRNTRRIALIAKAAELSTQLSWAICERSHQDQPQVKDNDS